VIRSSFIRSLLGYPKEGAIPRDARGQFSMARDSRSARRRRKPRISKVAERRWSTPRGQKNSSGPIKSGRWQNLNIWY